jgi:hypothetical protein
MHHAVGAIITVGGRRIAASGPIFDGAKPSMLCLIYPLTLAYDEHLQS